MIGRLDHVAIVVRDIEETLAFYRDILGLELADIKEEPYQAVRVAFLPVGESEIELVEPTTADSGVARFLQKRGEGLHHICLEVEDIEEALATLAAQGVRLIDEKPRVGGGGRRFAFVHPKSAHGVLLELIQAIRPSDD